MSELHSKLRKIESGEENSLVSQKYQAKSSESSTLASNQHKFYKNFKKIKRNHVAETSTSENPSKNYYLAFPALAVQGKLDSEKFEVQKQMKDSSDGGKMKESSGLCWSNVMFTKDQQKKLNQNHQQQRDKLATGNLERATATNKTNYSGSNKRVQKNSSCRYFYNNNNNHHQEFQQANKMFSNYALDNNVNFGQKKQSQVVKKKPKRQRNHFGE